MRVRTRLVRMENSIAKIRAPGLRSQVVVYLPSNGRDATPLGAWIQVSAALPKPV